MNGPGQSTAPRARFRMLSYGGLVLAFAGVLSYFTFFYRFPALRDVPWINLPLVLIGLACGVAGLRRAWGPGATRASRFLASFAFVLTALFAASFLSYVFWLSYDLPDPARAAAVGAPAPDFALPDASGRTVSLESLRGRKILLVFYRGHW